MYGFFGRMLVADASSRTCHVEAISEELYRKYLGGKGVGTHLLMEHAPVGVDPLSPENPLIFSLGPITDTKIWGGCRFGVHTKSPQTGFYAESYSGGKLAEKMSRTGFDFFMLTGAATSPVYLEVTEEGGQFHSAEDLWGLETYATEDALMAKHGGKAKCGAAVIGPAGENLVPFSIIANDYWRCAGRTGTGAVMGSKKIKGLVFVAGQAKRPVADPQGVEAFAKKTLAETRDLPATQNYKRWGTPQMVSVMNEIGTLPTRYWHNGKFSEHQQINGQTMAARGARPKACARCYIACGKLMTFEEGPYAGLSIEGPEFETIMSLGSLCLIDSLDAIAHLNDLCDRLGMDTISAGNLIAMAMDGSTRGLTPEAIAYGDVDGVTNLLKQMAARTGMGAILAQGSRAAAAEWGMADAVIHVKNLEPAAYDPRALKGMGLAYATSPRGACHMRATIYKSEVSGKMPPAQIEGKALEMIDYEDRLILHDTFVLCRFYRDFYLWPELTKIIQLTTGFDMNEAEVRETSRRVADLVRNFNLREGLIKEDDWLPERFFDEPLPETGASITREELAKMRSDYYYERGWNEEGVPRS
ncbi:aldehyde ferredoxin oxidoreductase family protein [Geopsychrobacter electrodiphilus]|uniref:aldehyde ferredoxin oxidoreductase family protein n=1 Tax=Geopsychrobacter electrodiphilus TaxID=225196 RepID=UPI00036B962C|nr:aldehyde ferredoxin oxidoreductase family protein [Geopsychrobacter electrodiphilus]